MEVIDEEALFDKQILGSGAFGAVYKANWSNKQVAVKYFNYKPIGDDPSSKREIDVLCRLQSIQHPNIINLYGTGCNGPQTFMVMELAPFSLDHVLHDHEYKTKYDYHIDHVISWALQIARALQCCHREEIIHRDIKPSNMLLFDEGRHLKLCDFGTAKHLDATSASTFIGTPYYLAPEVMEGKHSYKCDIYSFAISLWEMITRHKPTLNVNEKFVPNPFYVFSNIQKGQRLPEIIGIPRFLWEIIIKCWSEDPSKRPTAAGIVTKLNIVMRWCRDNMSLIDKSRISKTEIQKSPKLTRNYSLPQEKFVIHADAESLEVTDSLDINDETITNLTPDQLPPAVQATPGSPYYIEGLEQHLQPYIPLPNNSQSMKYYREYKSYMEQRLKIQKELQEMDNEKEKLRNQINAESRKGAVMSSTLQRYESVNEENKKLREELESLKH